MSEKYERADVVAGIGFYRPAEGNTTDEAIAMLSPYHAVLENADGFLTSATVKSIDGKLAAAYALWSRGTSLQGMIMIPELDMLFEELDSRGSVDVLLCDVWVIGSKIGLPPSLSSTYTVTIRELNTIDAANQGKVMDAGYTTLSKAFSGSGILFQGLHKSLDGEKVVEVGVWERREAAVETSSSSRYWEGMVESEELHVCQILYTPPPPSPKPTTIMASTST